MASIRQLVALVAAGGGAWLLPGCGRAERARPAAEWTQAPGTAALPSRRAPREPYQGETVDCTRAKCVALTFDDGPGPHTARLLDHLARARVRATFFVVGAQAEANAALLRRIVAERHELGNHTWSHARLTGLPAEGVRREVQRTQQAVHRCTGVRPRLFRPPYAVTDARVARAAGLPQIMWSVDPMDWRAADPERTVRAVLRDVHPGAIVLLHDTHAPTVAAVPQILARLERRGYRFVTVSELFGGTRLRAGRTYRQAPGLLPVKTP